MYILKFIVNLVLIFNLSTEESVTRTNYISNCMGSRLIEQVNENCRNDNQRRPKKRIRSNNNRSSLGITQIVSESMSNSEEGNDEFHFLVTGGYRPKEHELAKYVVSIRYAPEDQIFGSNHLCGGSIIAYHIILTAAHCMITEEIRFEPQDLFIVAGEPRRLLNSESSQIMEVSEIKSHAKYTNKTFDNDIALLFLQYSMFHGVTIGIILIPDQAAQAGLKCTTIGWGTVVEEGPLPDEIVQGDLEIQTRKFCSKAPFFKKGKICAKNNENFQVDSCQGDSGGPLICDNDIVGIVSYGLGCGRSYSLGVYTDVFYYRKWIKRNVATYLCPCWLRIVQIILTDIFGHLIFVWLSL